MNPIMILIPVLLPIIGGYGIFLLGYKDDYSRNIYFETIVVLTSIFTWVVILSDITAPLKVFDIYGGFSLVLKVDGLGMLFAGMVSIMWPLVMLYAFEYMEHSERKNGFFCFYVMTYGATLGLCFAGNITTLYVFYEQLSLVTIPLVSHYGNHESMYAGRKYAAYCIGGASLGFFSLIMAVVYGQAGGGFIFGGCLVGRFSYTAMRLAYLFGFFGYGVKAAIFPFHSWLPTAGVAPTPVTALLHAVAVVNAGVFSVVRLTWYMIGPDLIRGTWVQTVCLMTAAFTLVFAAVMALKERHFKRKLAFSTVSNLSYMLYGVMLLTPDGLQAGLAHMLFHGIIKITLFMCAGAFMHMTGNAYVFETNGVGKKMPLTFVFFTLGSLSLVGIPLFCGFISKWGLLMAGVREGSGWAMAGAGALILSAFLCAMYTLPISVRAFFPVEGKDLYPADCGVKDPTWKMLMPIGTFVVVNFIFGCFPGPIMHFLDMIAQGLL